MYFPDILLLWLSSHWPYLCLLIILLCLSRKWSGGQIDVLMNAVKVRKKDEADGCVTGRIRLSCCSHQSTAVLKITESKMNIALPGWDQGDDSGWKLILLLCFILRLSDFFFSLLSFNFLSEFSSCLWAVLVTLLPPHPCTHILRNLQVPELHGFLLEGHKDERFWGFLSPPLPLFPSFHFLSPKKNPTEQYFFSWSCCFCWIHWCCRSLLMSGCLWLPFHVSTTVPGLNTNGHILMSFFLYSLRE